ncbi:hypothetical protein BKA65DRAFT_600868 [Rhexocercosporidium sp. MPI-PUGE-AT-0058]|nr:hypothetical protein BKA65DRAFT_600868 [Rhexocercosporidium sp. MPI-PUGE-AT-0058]
MVHATAPGQEHIDQHPDDTITPPASSSAPERKKLHILDLPTELIIQISDFLSLFSTASFAFCNKRLATLIGRQSWTSLHTQPKERIQFLAILSRDLPHRHACHGCARLHSSKSIPRPGDVNAWQQSKYCTQTSSLGGHPGAEPLHVSNYFSPYCVCFAHVQLVLKRHYHGAPHGISLQDLNSTNIRLITDDAYFFSVEARIADGELLLRSQEWIVSSQLPREQFVDRRVAHAVCRHLMTYNTIFGLDDSLTGLMKCQLSHQLRDDNDFECSCMRLHQCLTCPMDYRLDVVDMQHLGPTLCVTKWFTLGTGSTVHDPFWNGHDLSADEPLLHGLPLGSIRSRYESHDGISDSDLRASNRRMMLRFLFIDEGCLALQAGGLGWKQIGCGQKIDISEAEDLARVRRRVFTPSRLKDAWLLAAGYSMVVVLVLQCVCRMLGRHG